MQYLSWLTFSHISLLLFFFIPFSYFGYHTKYWYLPQSLKTFDFFLMLLCTLLGGIVVVRIATSSLNGSVDAKLLPFLHLLPLILTLLIISTGKKARVPYAMPQQKRAVTNAQENVYQPKPENMQVEKISWNDLIIGQQLRNELLSVIELLKDPSTATKYGIDVPKGILLQGPPGTGKTSIAKVVANTAGLAFFILHTEDVVSKWLGESEKNLSTLFAVAQRNAPAVIFIDEVDSIGKSRAMGTNANADNLLNHLLQLIDGVVKTKGLYIIAATNRAELVDDALKRPGRLNKVIEIPLPDSSARKEIFRLYLSKLNLKDNVNLDLLAHHTNGASGAVIKAICDQAGLNAFQRESRGAPGKREYSITPEDLTSALYEFQNQVQR